MYYVTFAYTRNTRRKLFFNSLILFNLITNSCKYIRAPNACRNTTNTSKQDSRVFTCKYMSYRYNDTASYVRVMRLISTDGLRYDPTRASTVNHYNEGAFPELISRISVSQYRFQRLNKIHMRTITTMRKAMKIFDIYKSLVICVLIELFNY